MTGLIPNSETPARILAVENDPSTRRYLATVLGADGCVVTVVKDIVEARAQLDSFDKYDLLICDLLLQNEDGCAFISKLRREGARFPILILSSKQTEDTLAQALEAGADDYLQKPTDVNDLRQAVGMLLGRWAQRTRSKEQNAPLYGASVQVRDLEEGSFVELTAPNDSAQIESFQRLIERMVSDGMTPAIRANLRLALEEMIQNAKEWGNRFDPTKKVRVAYCLYPGHIVFRVEDEGAGFDPNAVPDPSIDPREHVRTRLKSGKRIGGWGVFMTRKLMDEVVYNAKGNVVYITKSFKTAEPPEEPATVEEPPSPASEVAKNPLEQAMRDTQKF